MPDHFSYDERRALLQMAEGDERAFHQFYLHYSALLQPFLKKYTRQEADIEEIIQETFIRVWVNRDRLPEIEHIKAWIFRVASRVYIDHLSRQVKIAQRKDLYGSILYGSGAAEPEERTALSEIRLNIHKAVEQLSEQKKKVFHLNRELDMKPAQIAEQLNMPVGTVKNQLSAALKEIREQLIAAGHGPIVLLCLHSSVLLFF
ncbi:RNA polymerase sigma factor [Parasegetibacter sp. NRK P23]|nr:RNA polymerase sigma factor [Parasegetibacter sp. NRK P23]